ncbi:hypothetical protein [Halomonas cupida]|uniref:hypothetical protein n=2 Tax=Halomonas cupida TaxID=44933 RepID=UPI001160E7C9|nr:hypothetical protein [Halomonas cupida]
MAAQGRAAVGHHADARPYHTSRSTHPRQCGADDNHIDQDELFDCHVINPACFHVGLMAAQGRAAVGHQADARPHHTSRSAHLCQCGADDNQIDQDELFDCHVNSVVSHKFIVCQNHQVPLAVLPLLERVSAIPCKRHLAINPVWRAEIMPTCGTPH